MSPDQAVQLRRAKAYAKRLLDAYLDPASIADYQRALDAYCPDQHKLEASRYFYELGQRCLRASQELDQARTDPDAQD